MGFVCGVFIGAYIVVDAMSEQDHGTIDGWDESIIDQELADYLAKFRKSQKRLPPEFEEILYENIEELYA